MSHLTWITDEQLYEQVKFVMVKGFEGIKKASKNFSRNSIDPFSAIFDASLQGISLDEWIVVEQRRQAQKTLQNALGHFHQNILAQVSGCRIPEENFVDFICDDRKIVAEIKNKHNTVKKSDLKAVYEELNQAVNHKTSKYHGYTAYYVTVIPAKPERFNQEFTPSDNSNSSKKSALSNIREIDGVSFYELITGQKDALKQLYAALPKVITKVIAELHPELNLAQTLKSTDLHLQAFYTQTFAE